MVAVAFANVAATASESAAGVREIEVSLDAHEPTPMLFVEKSVVTTVTFVDSAGAPWPIAALHGSEGAPHAVREASHPHVATLRAAGRQQTGNVVAFLEGLTEPVHLAVSRDAPAAARVRVRIAGTRGRRGVAAAETAAPPVARDDIERIVRDYLMANPAMLREAADPSRRLAANVRSLREEIIGQPGVPAEGDPSGSVTVVEFFDYACGYCKRSLDAMQSAVERTGVRVELREYPILGAGSERAARLALAADLQGRYLDAHIAANRQLAGRLGVTGTPAFLFLGPASVEVSPGALDATRMAELIGAVQ